MNYGNLLVGLTPWRVSQLLHASVFVNLSVLFDECELVKVQKSSEYCGRQVQKTWRLLQRWSIVLILLCCGK